MWRRPKLGCSFVDSSIARGLLRACGRALQAASPAVDVSTAIVSYCRIGGRSSLTWFVLDHLLGFEEVRN
jgi:3-mercaptopyruvate sulfurtransferase SseA